MLTVADVAAGERLALVHDEEGFARLGQGVDAGRRLANDAMDRVVAKLAAYKATAERRGAEQILIGATSASRDAANVDVLVARVRRELGLDYRVVSGEEEAALSFRGALALLDWPAGTPAVVLDVGGGSTEFVAGAAGAPPGFRVSLDVGSVRLTERFFTLRPPPAKAVAEAEEFVAQALARVPADALRGRPVVGVAGTAKVAARLAGSAGGDVPAPAIRAWRDRLLALTPEETLALDPALMSGRADVAAAGLLILDAALGHVGAAGFVASPGGLRHGIALSAIALASGGERE